MSVGIGIGIGEIYYIVGISFLVVSSIVTPILWINKRFKEMKDDIDKTDKINSKNREKLKERVITLEGSRDHHEQRIDEVKTMVESIRIDVSGIKDSITSNHNATLNAIASIKVA